MARELRGQFRPIICKTFLWFDQCSDSWRSFGKKEFLKFVFLSFSIKPSSPDVTQRFPKEMPPRDNQNYGLRVTTKITARSEVVDEFTFLLQNFWRTRCSFFALWKYIIDFWECGSCSTSAFRNCRELWTMRIKSHHTSVNSKWSTTFALL